MTADDYDSDPRDGLAGVPGRSSSTSASAPGLLEEFVGFLQKGPSVIEQVTAAHVPYLSHGDRRAAVRVSLRRPHLLAVHPRPVPHAGQGRAGHAVDVRRPERRRHRWLRRDGRPPACGSAAGAPPARCWPSRSGTGSCGPTSRSACAQTDEAGLIPILHFDSDWTRDLPRLLELPGEQVHPLARQHDRHPQGQGDPRRPHVHHGRRAAGAAQQRHAGAGATSTARSSSGTSARPATSCSRAATSRSTRRWRTSRRWRTRPPTRPAEPPTAVQSGAGRRPRDGRRRPAPLLSGNMRDEVTA